MGPLSHCVMCCLGSVSMCVCVCVCVCFCVGVHHYFEHHGKLPINLSHYTSTDWKVAQLHLSLLCGVPKLCDSSVM